MKRRNFIVCSSIIFAGLPCSSEAFIQGIIIRQILSGLIRSAGRASRSMVRTVPRRGSRVYGYAPSPIARQLAAERQALLAERINRQNKSYLKNSLRLSNDDLPYVTKSDRDKLIDNFEKIIDRIDTLNDIRDLVDFVRKFDNAYDAVFALAKDEIDSDENLLSQFSMVTEGIDLDESELIWDRNLERELRRLRSPFLNF